MFDELCAIVDKHFVGNRTQEAVQEAWLVTLPEPPMERPDGAEQTLRAFRLPHKTLALGWELSSVLLSQTPETKPGLAGPHMIIDCQPVFPGGESIRFEDEEQQEAWEEYRKALDFPKAAHVMSISMATGAELATEENAPENAVFAFEATLLGTYVLSKNRMIQNTNQYRSGAMESGCWQPHVESTVFTAVQALNQVALLHAHGYECVRTEGVEEELSDRSYSKRARSRPRYAYQRS